MDNFAEEFKLRRPDPGEAETVLALMIACDVAEYGEPDSSLEDLQDEWAGIELGRDAWLALTAQDQLAGYAAVFRNGERFTFDIYVHPAMAPAGLSQNLMALCERRAVEQLEPGVQATATIFFSQVNQRDMQAAEQLGFKPRRYHFGMRIHFDGPPPAPAWAEGITLRTAVPGQDDMMIYDFIQAAFERPGRVPPSFEHWHDFMIGASNFESDLWFLAYHGDELVGAILCFDYPQYGWVRQLGVSLRWRGHGLGSALLRHVFGVFYRRGHTTVGLGVEADNPTAYRLYEQVGMKRLRQYTEYSKALSRM